MQPVSVIGAHGFIGRNLVGRFAMQGQPTIALDRGGLDDEDALRAVAKSSTIYWAASTINPAIAAADPTRAEADLAVFRNFLDTLDELNSDAKVVFFSSGGTVYGNGEPPFREDSPANPISEYGKAKLLQEAELRSRARAGVSVRISNPYGPGQYPAPGQGVIGHWLFAAAADKTIQLIGSLGVVRDYIFIDDLIDALVTIQGYSNLPDTLNIGSGQPTKLSDVLSAVKNAVGTGLDTEAIASRSFDVNQVWLDCSKAQEELGWRAATSLDDGVKKTWEWVSGLAAHGGLSR